jgi:seryl-tRNA synthetase
MTPYATGVRTRIDLSAPLPQALSGEVERRLLFVSPEITGFELAIADGEVHGVILYSGEPLQHDAMAAKVNYVVDNDVRPQWVTQPSPVWTSPHRRGTHSDVFDMLAAAGAVSAVGEGQVAVGEPLLSLLGYFDRAVLDLLADDFVAREYRYPTLIRTSALEAAGYFSNFPQHLMFVTRLRNDVDVYRAFQHGYAGAGIDSTVLDLAGNVDYCLPPTMCYHTFQQYSGRELAADRLHVVTSRGKSFRFEAGYATTLERLWDFTIREIVFLGSREDVLNARELFMRKVFAFVDALGLSGSCEVGNDPFFCGADTSQRIWSQRLMELKYELRLDVAPEKTIAVGSFNFHDDLFGRAFAIDHGGGGPIRSGCVGFGLERLVYAFLCQYGLERDDWPDRVRSESPT